MAYLPPAEARDERAKARALVKQGINRTHHRAAVTGEKLLLQDVGMQGRVISPYVFVAGV